jgi:flagellar hook-associated protein 1 FlgK
MGTLFSALSIGQSGLRAAQVQLDTTGHNIANVNKEGFSRQRVDLAAFSPISMPFGQIGRGVRVAGINRLRDPLLDILYRNQVAGLNSAQIQAQYYGQIQDVFLEPTADGLSGRLNRFFEALQQFSVNVESLPVRANVLVEAQQLAGLLNDTYTSLNNLRSNANEEVIRFVPEINSLAQQIATLNDRIRISEATENPANDLRDDRDVLVDKLAAIVNVTANETDNGAYEVFIGGEVLVSGTHVRTVEAVQNALIDPARPDLVELRYTDNNLLVQVQDGELYGALQIRDQELPGVIADINEMASTLIQQINLIHSQANGLSNLSGTVTASNGVTDSAIDLATAGLPFAFTPGTFQVNVYDNTGALIGGSPFTITVAAGDSLDDVVTQLNAVANLTATVNSSGQLAVTSAAGFSFGFANDNTGLLAAAGMNGLFTGSDAQSIGVNQDLVDNPALLGGAFDTDPAATGDNSAALALAAVQDGLYFESNSADINDFYESIVVGVGINARANDAVLTVEATVNETLERRRQEISGVSTDEEVAMLIQFQRAFEASARVITVTDRMLESLLAMAL